MSNSTIEIDTGIFKNNLQAIRTHLNLISPKTKFCLPVKADAYGHGLIPMALLAEPFVDYYGVASMHEGALLRNSGIIKPILVFGAFSDADIPGLVKNNLEITVSSKFKAESLTKFCDERNLTCNVHIKVDTGMGRVGVRVDSAKDLIDFVNNNPTLILTGLYSHLACSEEKDRIFTLHQLTEFAHIVTYVKMVNPSIICHIANSGAVCYYPNSYLDMVRPGILSYGYFPGENVTSCFLSQIKPCYTLKSQVVYFKTMGKNLSISYNRTYFTNNFTRVVTIPIGYGDGYRRALSNIGNVIIRGKKYTISGTICMDMLMVDIGQESKSYVGDEVILIGNQGNETIYLEDVAEKCGTNVYEILCGFTSRVPREYK